MAAPKIYSSLTTLEVVIVALLVALLGLGLLYAAGSLEWLANHLGWQTVVRELGTLLLTSVALLAIWELVGRRSFVREIWALANLTEDIQVAGLTGITDDFQRGVDWRDLFKTVRELDVFCAYGATWRASNTAELRALAGRKGADVRIVLPDPENRVLMEELGRRFGSSATDVKAKVETATREFREMFTGRDAVCSFRLWYHSESPVFSCYRFDHRAVLALYKHAHERGPVPSFIADQGGSLGQFLRAEFGILTDGKSGLSRQVYPPNEQTS